MVQISFPGNDFATITKSRLKIFWRKFLVQNYFRGNDFATIKIFDQKLFDQKIFIENFWFKPISEEMILRP